MPAAILLVATALCAVHDAQLRTTRTPRRGVATTLTKALARLGPQSATAAKAIDGPFVTSPLQKDLHVLKVKGHRIGPEELVPEHA
jgi:hypothetical protein